MNDRKIPVHCANQKMVLVEDLLPNPRNPNKHPDSQIKLLAKIISHTGWRSPIVVSKNSGFIVAGHGRLAAAKLLGCKYVPVDYQGFTSEADEWAHLIADNRLAELAETDGAILKDVLLELDTGDFDMELTGFDDKEMERVINSYGDHDQQDAEPQIDRAAELNKKWKVKTGDLWRIGEHRLLCGDSTKRVDVQRVMGGEKAVMLFADPPYGVSYASKNEFLNAVGRGNRIQKPIDGDHKTPDEMSAFWVASFSAIRPDMREGGSYYVTGPQGGDLLLLLLLALRESDFPLRHMLIWAKNNHVLGRCDYHYKHEPIIYGWVDGAHSFYGGHSEFSLWEIDKPHASELHPTTKPVEIVARGIRNSTKVGEVVADPFLGSGTTMVACQNLGRKCRGIEISPEYCAVILERMKTAFPNIEICLMKS